MSIAHDQLYNLVILPVSAPGAGQRFQLSATRGDGGDRLVSPAWTEQEVIRALTAVDVTRRQVEELFRGNQMAFGGRDPRPLLFEQSRLAAMNLQPVATGT